MSDKTSPSWGHQGAAAHNVGSLPWTGGFQRFRPCCQTRTVFQYPNWLPQTLAVLCLRAMYTSTRKPTRVSSRMHGLMIVQALEFTSCCNPKADCTSGTSMQRGSFCGLDTSMELDAPAVAIQSCMRQERRGVCDMRQNCQDTLGRAAVCIYVMIHKSHSVALAHKSHVSIL